MQRAYNPQTGEYVFLYNNQWVKPEQIAKNPQTGETAFLVGNEWQVVPATKPVTSAASESPILSPEESLMSVIGSPVTRDLTQAPKPPAQEKPMTYKEAVVDAVNYLQEGVSESQVKKAFPSVKWKDISAEAQKRGMFVPKVIEEYTPEQVEERVKKFGELKGVPETDFREDPVKWTYEAFKNVGKRVDANYGDVATSLLLQAGAIDPIGAAFNLKENARQREAAAPSMAIQEGMQKISSAETYGDVISEMFKNPRATFTMLVDSVATSVPLIAPSLALAPAGPLAAGAAAFVGSAGLEYGSVMADVLQEKGVALNDAFAIDRALRNPKIMEEIKDKGAKRGLIVGGFDAITMGMAGRFLKPVNKLIGTGKLSGDAAKKATIAAWGKELALQTAGGAGGELLAQQATGEDRPADVVLEALAGAATAPLEVTSALREAKEIEAARPTPPAPPTAPPTARPVRIEPTLAPPTQPPAPPPAPPVTPPVSPAPESAFEALTLDTDEETVPVSPPVQPAQPQPITPFPLAPAPETLSAISPPVFPEGAIVGFKTAKGSTYELDAQGRSSRTKQSPGRGQGETYLPHTVFYVKPEDSRSILDDKTGAALSGGASIRLGYQDGNIFKQITDISQLPKEATPLVAVVDRSANKIINSYAATTKPAIGLAPIEKLYSDDGMSNTHVGNPIVELFTKKPQATIVAPQALPEEPKETVAPSQRTKPEFILQNRDRSGTASVQQMQSIAKAPDYSRAGFSRTADGAPIIAMATIPEAQLGRADSVTTPRGRKIPVQYAVVEADDVITSNDISGRPNPTYGDQSVQGARAIAGNGRVTGLRESFNLGTANKYVEDLSADSNLHGVSPDVIANMKKPILVRVMPDESLTKDIGDELNLSEKLELSPVEQAKNDLNRVDFETLQFDEEGEITNQSLAQFINAQPVEERAKLVDRNLPTKQARQRLENAIFARAYQDDDLIAMFAQTDDPEAKLVISALAQVAPQMAKLEGAGNLDIRPIISDAAKIIISGKRKGLKLTDIANQMDVTVDPDTRIIVSLFAQNPRSNKAAIEALRTAAEVAYQESIKPEEGLFGVEPKRERRQILEEARDEQTGAKDVAAAERAGVAPSDVKGKVEPGAAGIPEEDQGFQVKEPETLSLGLEPPEQPPRKTRQEKEAEGFRLMPGPAPERAGVTLDLFGTEGLSQLPPPSQLTKKKAQNARQLGLFEDGPIESNEDNPAGEAARRDAVSTVDDLQSTDTILGLALSDDYAARQRVNLVGQKINNYEDLAVLSQVYRHPRFETFRLFFTDKDGNIVSQLGITSRLPGSSRAVLGEDADNYLKLVQKAAKEVGASGYWMLHNHPSGNVEFSNADISLTKGFNAKMLGLDFNGHIVLNTNEFGLIDEDMRQLKIARDMGQKKLIETYGNIGEVFNPVEMAKKVDENPESMVVIAIDANLQVVGITSIANSDLIGREMGQVRRMLFKLAITNMGGRLLVASRNQEALTAVAPFVEDGVLIEKNGKTKPFRELFSYRTKFLFPSDRPGTVSPDTSKLFDFLRVPKKPILSGRLSQPDTRVFEPEQEDLFGAEPAEDRPVETQFRIPPGRSEELTLLAQKLQRNEITKQEYDAAVNKYLPIYVFTSAKQPATDSEMSRALNVTQRQKINTPIPEGTRVGSRIDIDAKTRHKVAVVVIHEAKPKVTSPAAGKALSYQSTVILNNPKFAVGREEETLKIAAGKKKNSLQTIEGELVNMSPEETYRMAQAAMNNPDYVQVGFDPFRHSYFWNRKTTMPVISASQIIQIGDMVLAKNPVFGEKSQFLFSLDQGNLFGEEDAPKKKIQKGRSPELAILAERLKRGEITKAEYDEAVNRFKPIFVYESVPTPATNKEVSDALDSNKRSRANIDLPSGTKVGLRLDIPAFEKNNTFVVAIHEAKPSVTSPRADNILSYRSVAALKNAKFAIGNQSKTLEIAVGKFKDKLQTIEGSYVSLTPDEAFKKARAAFNDPSYVQVGFNPIRHAYFYDRRTTMPVVSADEVIQIGNLILAKNPVYGTKEDFLFDIDTTITIDQIRTAKDKDKLQEIREDVIRKYASLRRRREGIVGKIKKGQVSIGLQRELTLIDDLSREYKEAIDASAERRDSAEAFLAKALQEFDKGNISEEVLAVIQAAYLKAPNLLEGLMLSVRTPKGERGVAGSFDAFNRIISLYKGTSGIENPGTFRHELTHALEQMMTADQQIALIDAWAAAIKNAMRKHLAPGAKDREKFQKFFDAVQKFMDNPTERNKAEAVKLLPGRDFYQFVSPSEFWAVNAENLMAARLGPAWERFKSAIRRLFEGLKKVFGFDNRYDIHRIFKEVAYGNRDRTDYSMVDDMILDGTYEKRILNALPDDVDDYMNKYDRPDTPYETSTPVKDAMLGAAQASAEAAKNAVTNPVGTASNLIGSVDRQLTKAQIDYQWFGSGLDAADFSRYNGQLRDGNQKVAASVYATMAMHAGHIGTQVIMKGRLIFNATTQLFQAVDDQYSLANIVRLKAEIIKMLGEQRAANLVNTYFEAKRARSIQDEYQKAEADYQNALTPEAKQDTWEQVEQIIRAYDKIPPSFLKKNAAGDILEVTVTGPKGQKRKIAVVDDVSIDEAIDFEQQVPQLADMMTNWTAVNRNMLDMMRFAGILSKDRHQRLKAIKDYVPWYRVMDGAMDIHEPTGGAVRGLSNVPRERRFGKGRTDLVVDDIVDNMLHNVLLLTKNVMRNYANNRIIEVYAARDAKGRIKVAPREGPLPNGSVGVKALINGRRVIVEITDPLVAAASIGMENLDLPVNGIIAAFENIFRRGITTDPFFQAAQVIKDAPTAAWVTGVRNPVALISGVFQSFLMSLIPNDPIVEKLRSYGIGGFQSLARSPERQLKIEIGLINQNALSRFVNLLDKIGDASDFAQRRAIYNRVLKETGDETQALLQANNVIDFMKRGASREAQWLARNVAFMNAYAQSINVLAQALAGGGLKGMSRKKALARMAKTGGLLAASVIGYSMVVAGSEEYEELDDQTRLRNLVIPGSKAMFGETILIPMNTSAAFIFKAIPEMIYNTIIREGTATEVDGTRLKTALKEAALDSLLGPTPAPSALKPAFEIAINRNFWSGSTVIPRNLENVEAAEQYNASTSEAAKVLSGLTSVGDKRILSPIEMDHLVRGMFGTAGYLTMFASNMFAEDRVDPRLRDLPGLGRFFAGPVGRKQEDLYYDLKDRAEKKYQTFMKKIDRAKFDEIDKMFDENADMLAAYSYVQTMDPFLKDINEMIRYIGENKDYGGTPKEKREEITDFQELKALILDDIEERRKDAGL